ncbi:alpha/beta fold hydrolase [Actinomadura decatromicini]|uniref:alpha/beta fold hydrolase n=1 Tax=Actinomadura decatromicini TaxID=2604572 RepID=UPI001FEB9801|nr:alpha/beta hydrolase [Actinomadura decatromicini]
MDIVKSADGTRIAYDRTGDGPALIYVGGALNDRGSGAALAALLAPDHAVLAYDRRGRGDSGDTPPYTVEREIEDIAALIGAAGGAATRSRCSWRPSGCPRTRCGGCGARRCGPRWRRSRRRWPTTRP